MQLSDKERIRTIDLLPEDLKKIINKTEYYYWINNQLVKGPFDPEEFSWISKYSENTAKILNAYINKPAVLTSNGNRVFGMWVISSNTKDRIRTSWINFTYPHSEGIRLSNLKALGLKTNLAELKKDLIQFQTSLLLLGIPFESLDLNVFRK